MKRIITYILLIAILVSLCACVKQEETATTAPVAEPATEATLDPSSPEAMFGHIDQTVAEGGVHKIWNAEGVQFMLQNPNNDYILLCNIDMEGLTVAPMGEFTGKIAGENFIISNLTVQGGDEENFGIISTNKGEIADLKFENVTLNPGTKAKNIGSLVGKNEGLLSRCTITGVMNVETTGADANVGSLVGYTNGTVQNMELTVDLNVTATNAANVGGIAGKIEGGEVKYVDTLGKIDVTGEGKSVGLFTGNTAGVTIVGCAFVGASNTIDGKLFTNFTGNPDDDERATALNALWRDNSAEPLTPGQEKLRNRVVEEMYKICSVEWTVNNDLVHACYCSSSTCHGIYNAKYTYVGVPYNHKGGSLDRFYYCMNPDNTMADWVYEQPAFDGFDAYIGNDCSTSTLQALWTVSNSVDYIRVRYELPQFYDIGGCLPVGDYFWDFPRKDSDYTTMYWDYNTEQEMYEAYACMRRGDLIAAQTETVGHTRMIAADAVVVRDQDGKINSTYSYVLCHEQGSSWIDEETKRSSSCKTNWKYTFGALKGKSYVPITCEELITGEMEPVECSISRDAPGKLGLTTGYIKANYYLDSVTLKITDSKGDVVFNQKMFTTASRRAETGDNDQIMRNYRDDYDMAYFATPLQKLQLKKGETYSYSITARLGTYDEIVVKEDSFVNN